MKKFFYLLIAALLTSITGITNAATMVTYQEPSYKKDDQPNHEFNNYPLRFAKEISLSKDGQNSTWTHDGNRVFYNYLENLSITAMPGETITANFKANDAERNTSGAEDLRWTVVLLFIDWNQDGTFEYSEKIAGTYGNTQGNTDIYDVTKDITVPANTNPGSIRVRLNYTNAWFFKGTTITDYANMSKEGIVYDFDLDIEARPSRTVTIQAGEGGSATITAPAGAENGSITTPEAVEISATANSGYIFNNWTDKAGNIITANPYTYSGGENIVLTAHFSKSSYQVTYIKENFDFDHENLKNRYLESITIGDKTKEFTVKPSNVWTVLSDMTVNAAVGETVNTHMIAKNMGDYNTDTQIPDLRYTAVYLAADWDGDGVFEDLQKIKGNTPPKHNVGGNADPNDLEGYVMDFNYNITIPDNAVPGKTARVRLNYTNAWVSNYINGNIDILKTSCKEGIVYDFDIVIEEFTVARTVTVTANDTNRGTVSITSPTEGVSDNSVSTTEPVTVLAEANKGYYFVNWTIGEDVVSTTPEYTYSGAAKATLTANFEPIVNRLLETKKGVLYNNGQFQAGHIVRGNIPIGIIGESNAITMASWVKIDRPTEDTENPNSNANSIDRGNAEWNKVNGRLIIGSRQESTTGYGSDVAFGIVVKGADNANKLYKMTLYAKGTIEPTNLVDVPEGWFHLAFTISHDNTTTTMKMFVNGKESMSVTDSRKIYERFNDLALGDNMNAWFDNVMIWNTELDASDISTSMKGYTDEQIQGQNNLVGYFTCDDLTDYNAVSANLVKGSMFNLRRDKMSYPNSTDPYTQKCTKSEYTGTGVAVLSERQIPRGGAKFYLNNEEITAENWEKNGNENFGYLVNSPELTHLAYNGVEEPLTENVLAVYHNGNPALPTFVRQSDIITNAELEVPQIQSSYVAAGLEYTITMPSVAKQWMPISLPAQVDLVAGPSSSDKNNIVGLRPGYNFWYSTFNSGYTNEINYSDIWNDIQKDTNEETSKVYLLDAGIISVPDSRKGQPFTFYTKYNTPIVMRAWNDQFNSTLMPEPGKLGFVKNPYSFKVTVTDIAKQIGPNMTVYVYNPQSGNFDIPQEGVKFIVDRFVPFFVFNGNGTTQKAPRYIGTKDVSGVLEVEAVYDVNVSGTQGAIEIKTFVPTEIEIFTINGTLVAANEVNGTHSFTLEAGIYIVRTVAEGNTKTFKVIVE